MEKNTGKVREKSGNFVIPEKWEPCQCETVPKAPWRQPKDMISIVKKSFLIYLQLLCLGVNEP